MPINPANLASPDKSAAAHGLSGPKGPQANRAGGNEHHSTDGTHGFGSTLHDAMQGSDACQQDSPKPRPQIASNAHAATPAVPAHVAEQAKDEETSPAADAQLDGGLQAFVNSLQTPLIATAMPATTGTMDPADTSAALPTTAAEADGVGVLAADAAGTGKAYAFGLDEPHGARLRAQNGSALDSGSAADATDAAGNDKVEARDVHASLRAQEVAASKVAPEFRAALNDAQATRTGLQQALAAENGSSGSGLAQAIAAAAGTPAASLANAAAPEHAAHVAPRLHSAPWQDAFGQQVVWMARNEQQIASLTMNPPDLGPVRVTLSVSDGQASAAFVSLQPEVRQAIQDAVPRLKEMLAEAGLQLQQASVDSGDAGRQSASRAQGENDTRGTRSAGAATEVDDAAMAAEAASLRTARSIAASRLVDLFA